MAAGIEVLDDLMRSHGFVYSLVARSTGSGGKLVTGEFRRGNRALELHYRYSLGLIRYHVGDLVLSHEDYMLSVLARRWQSAYPGFSNTPLDAFRHLRLDLERHCQSFLVGTDAEFSEHVNRATKLAAAMPRLP